MKSKSTLHASQDYRKLTDEDVIYRYVHRHEHGAFTCLYERYAHIVLGVCFKYLKETEAAKDATQQIFIKLLDDLKRFEIAAFKPWLLQVVRNYCLMQLRKSLLVVNNTIELGEDVDFEEVLHPATNQEALLESLETSIKELNSEQRICVELFYLKRLTYATIATQQGYTLNEVKSHIQNGKRNLRNKLIATHGATVQS